MAFDSRVLIIFILLATAGSIYATFMGHLSLGAGIFLILLETLLAVLAYLSWD